MTHDEALQAVAADMHAALRAWRAADKAQQDVDNWLDDVDDDGWELMQLEATNAWQHARTLTSAVNRRIAELRADSVTPVTLDIGGDE